MTSPGDHSAELRDRVRAAMAGNDPLYITGGGSKEFYGNPCNGTALHVTRHRGIVAYAPSELVVTARAGTPLDELELTLAEQGQMLGFEPPRFGPGATLGGAIACGLSGPRRPYTGAARDFVLGVRCLSGRGEIGRFGGEVIKNVAGYDIARLTTGALGTLGVILEVSLKVLPLPPVELTLRQACTRTRATALLCQWARQPLPVSAACFLDDTLYVRLSGNPKAVLAAQRELGGESMEGGTAWWRDLREQGLAYFQQAGPLWRLSVPLAAPPMDLPGKWLMDWGGAQRWLISDLPAAEIRAAATARGGHATLFRNGSGQEPVFQPLSPALVTLHRRLKQAFDPAGILNPGRLYPDL